MSHFTSIQTQMVEQEFLTKALTDLGYQWEAGDVEIRGFGGERRKVEVKVRSRAGILRHEIGFKKSGSGYVMIADWWNVGSGQRESFQQQLLQRYAYHAARAKLEEQGFSLVSEETQQDGRLHLVLRRAS